MRTVNKEQWESFWEWLEEELWPHDIGDYDLVEYLNIKKALYEAKFTPSVPYSQFIEKGR